MRSQRVVCYPFFVIASFAPAGRLVVYSESGTKQKQTLKASIEFLYVGPQDGIDVSPSGERHPICFVVP